MVIPQPRASLLHVGGREERDRAAAKTFTPTGLRESFPFEEREIQTSRHGFLSLPHSATKARQIEPDSFQGSKA